MARRPRCRLAGLAFGSPATAALLLVGCASSPPAPSAAVAPIGMPRPLTGYLAATTPLPGAGPARPEPARAWPTAESDCRNVLAAIVAGHAAGTLPREPAGAPLTVVEAGPAGALALDIDVALPVTTPERVALDARCLLVVARPAAPEGVQRRNLGRQTVRSEYESRRERRANPEYVTARQALAEARRDERRQDPARVHATGDLTLDVIGLVAGGLIQGIGGWLGSKDLDAAKAKLDATPPFLEEPVYASYRLTVEEVEVERTVGARLALVDTAAGTVRDGRRRLTERRTLSVADGLHPRDREVREGRARWVQPAAVRELEAQPLRVRLSDVLAWSLAETGAAPPRPGDLAGLLTEPLPGAATAEPAEAPVSASRSATARVEPAAGPAPTPSEPPAATGDRRRSAPADAAIPASAVVTVSGMGGSGKGFYIGDEDILTARALLGDSSLAKIGTAGGAEIWGVVVVEAEESGLAVVHVQKAGPPLPLASSDDTRRLVVPPADAAAGAPIVEDGRVVAVTLDPVTGRVADAGAVAAILRALKAR